MKNITFCTLTLLISLASHAQTVLVGKGTPTPQAIMEVRSTTGGLLMPRMTNLQRLGIPAPAAGLLVFDSSVNRVYGRDGSFWRYFIDDSYWKLNGNHVYNITDSVGINTSTPQERLHVFSDVLLTNGNAIITANAGSSSKISFDYTGAVADGYSHQVNFLAGGIRKGKLEFIDAAASGGDNIQLDVASTTLKIQSNGVTYFNAVSPTLQLQSSLADKGFMQLNGKDFRIGTNSGNDAGNFIIRSGGTTRLLVDAAGNVGINQSNPQHTLHVSGNVEGNFNLVTDADAQVTNIRLVTSLVKPATSGNANLLPFGYGKVTGPTAACACSRGDISVSGNGYGNYFISYPGMTRNDVMIMRGNDEVYVSYYYESDAVGFRVITKNNFFGGSNTGNYGFSFIVFK